MGPTKKRFSVVYRRSTHDKREYGTNRWKRHFLDIIALECKPGEKDLARVKRINGKFKYTPSRDYNTFLEVIREQESLLVAANEKRQHLLTENNPITCTSQPSLSSPSVGGPIRKGKR